jgi:hypothetical protein
MYVYSERIPSYVYEDTCCSELYSAFMRALREQGILRRLVSAAGNTSNSETST